MRFLVIVIMLMSILPMPITSVSKAASTGLSVAHPGKELAFSRQKGNCLTCHVIDDGELPGNIGPALVDLDQRYPDREALRIQIWDATSSRKDSFMPPYGRHRILSDEEIDAIVDYLWSLRSSMDKTLLKTENQQ